MQPDSVSNKNNKQTNHSNETNRISSKNAHKLELALTQTRKYDVCKRDNIKFI